MNEQVNLSAKSSPKQSELARNPALHKAGLKNWLHSTQMPEWLKQEILAQEGKRK